MSDRSPRRRELLWDACKGEGVDAFLVASVTNVSYLTGFTGDDSTFLLGGGDGLVISDGRYRTQLEHECPDLAAHIRPVGQLMIDGVVDCVKAKGYKRLGFESPVVSVADYEELKEKLPAVEFVGLKEKVEGLRIVKDDGEVALIREAIDYAERAFAMTRAALRRDQTEKDVTDALEAAMRRCGASSAASTGGRRVGSTEAT